MRGDRARSAPPSASPRGSRPSATAASAAPRRRPAPSSACARSSTSRSSAATPAPSLTRFEAHRASASRTRSPSASGSAISPHAPYTVSRRRWAACVGLGLPVATHLAESAAEHEWLVHGAGPMAERARPARRAAGRDGHPRRSRGAACSGRRVVAAHCVDVDDGGDRAARRARRRRSRTARARTRCSAAASRRSRELRAAGVRVGLGTDSPASTPSFDMFEELRTAVISARARERAARRALARPRRSSSRRSARPARSASTTRSARSSPASAPTSPSSRSRAHRYLPWEDPAAAVVFGGSPEPRPLDGRRRSTALPERRDRMARADRRRAARAKPCCCSRAQLRERLRRHREALLPAPAPPGEVGVRLPRARLRRRLRRLRRRRRAAPASATSSGVGGGVGGSPSVDEAREAARGEPERRRRRSASSRRRCRRRADATRRSRRSSSYIALRPKDDGRAPASSPGCTCEPRGARRQRARASRRRRPRCRPGRDFLPPSTSPLGQALGAASRSRRPSPAKANAALNEAYTTHDRPRTSRRRARYQQLVEARARRRRPSQLAARRRGAERRRHATAIAAYKRFLELAPDDPSAPLVKQQIKQLQSATTARRQLRRRLDSATPAGRHIDPGERMNFDIKTEQLGDDALRDLARGRGRPLHGAGVQAAAARGDRARAARR